MSTLSQLAARLQALESTVNSLLNITAEPPAVVTEGATESTETTATADPVLPADTDAVLTRLEAKVGLLKGPDEPSGTLGSA